jgi:nucleotide-binding universal stress UspA family protein
MTPKDPKPPILIPVDFSAHSEAALVFAAKLASCMQLHLQVLHVVHDPGEMPGYFARIAKKKTLARMQDVAAEMLEEFVSGVQKRHNDLKELKKAEIILVTGIPVTRIIQVADKNKAAMIVMGCKGQTGLKHLLVGSVAEQVVQLASVPVTVVKAQPKS